MVTLPPPFTATKYLGYFWNTETKELFSLKQGGVLRKMRRRNPIPGLTGKIMSPYYTLSVNGERKFVTINYLHTLKLKDSVIPETSA